MQAIFKIIGWIFVMLGVVLPLALGFLWWQRPDLCTFYLDHVKSYGSLTEDQRRSLDKQLDAQIAVMNTGVRLPTPINQPKPDQKQQGTTLP